MRGAPLDLLYGISAFVIIIGVVRLEQLDRLRVPGVVNELGNASYAIYLVHLSVLSLSAKVLRRGLPASVPTIVPFVVLFVVAVGCGWLLHRAIEKPILIFPLVCAGPPGTRLATIAPLRPLRPNEVAISSLRSWIVAPM